jgi:NAD(P)H-dependent FMN reductase
MKKFIWDLEIERTLDSLISIFPDVVRERWWQRIRYNAEKISAYQEKERIDKDIFWQSVYEILPLGYEPLILRYKDPKKLQEEAKQSKEQEGILAGEEPLILSRWGKGREGISPVPKGKKFLAVNSSSRKGGNTDLLLDEVIHALRDNGSVVEKLYLADLFIKPCTGCRVCRIKDVETFCVIKDDMTQIYEKLYSYDGFIAGFPIYTARENGIMANFMDRWDCLSNPFLTRKMPKGKKGMVICTWMWPNPTAYDDVVEGMVILLRLHGIETMDVLTLSGTRGKKHGKGVVKNHPEILKEAYQTGVNFLGYFI